ncbi:MAG: hypothetical protein ABI605_04860 [Rhizobacter sp.]
MAEWLLRVRESVAMGLPLRWWLGLVTSAALTLVFAPAAIAVVALLWLEREVLIANLLRSAERVDARGMVVGFLLVWPVLWTTVGGMTPGDDVLRHFAAWRHDYDYHRLYVALDPRFPHESMWVGYEWVIGFLHRALGLQLAILVLQWTIYSAAAYSLWRTALVLVPDREDAWTWRLVVVSVLLLTQLIFRIAMARPEALFAVWAMSAIWMRPWVWLTIGMAIQPLYWLGAIYAPAAILLRASWRMRIACVVGPVVAAALFWFSYAGWAWPQFYWLSFDWIRLRLAPVGENESILLALMIPGFTATLLLLIWRGKIEVRRDWPVLALLGWFLLPGQIRYLSTVHAWLVVLVTRTVTLPRLQAAGQLAVWLAVVVSATYGVTASGKLTSSYDRGLPHFKTLESTAQVLTAFDQATYFLPTDHPGIRSAPAMELGATLQPVQALAVTLSGTGTGVLNCEALRSYGFTHVVEKRMAAASPCLEVQEISNGWRLWRVRAP